MNISLSQLKPKNSRTLILTAGAVLLLLGVGYRYSPDLGSLLGPGQELAVKERKLVKYRELVQQGDDLNARFNALKAAVAKGESGLLTGKTPSLAAADLQNILQRAAEKCQVEIRTVRVLKPEATDADKNPMYLSIPVQFTITSTVSQLKKLIHLIESHPKYLKLTKVRSRATSSARRRLAARRSRSTKAQQVAEQIRSDITVTGFFKKEEVDAGRENRA